MVHATVKAGASVTVTLSWLHNNCSPSPDSRIDPWEPIGCLSLACDPFRKHLTQQAGKLAISIQIETSRPFSQPAGRRADHREREGTRQAGHSGASQARIAPAAGGYLGSLLE